MTSQPQPMTPERLAEIEARANAATPGPWKLNDWRWSDVYAISGPEANVVEICTQATREGGHKDYLCVSPENKAFLLSARTDIPDLCAALREWQRVVVAMRETLHENEDREKALEARVERLEAENADLKERIRRAIEVGERALATPAFKSTGNPILDSAIASSLID